MDMEGFWPVDNYRIIAVIFYWWWYVHVASAFLLSLNFICYKADNEF